MLFDFLRDRVVRASDAVYSGASNSERFVARLVRARSVLARAAASVTRTIRLP